MCGGFYGFECFCIDQMQCICVIWDGSYQYIDFSCEVFQIVVCVCGIWQVFFRLCYVVDGYVKVVMVLVGDGLFDVVYVYDFYMFV